jgi:hypothetical protein
VWDSEFTTKAATLQGGSAEIAPTPNVKLWVLVVGSGGDWWRWWRATPFLAQSPFRIYLDLREQFRIQFKEPSLGRVNFVVHHWNHWTARAMRAIASLGCEGAM